MKVPDTIYLQNSGDCADLGCCDCTFEKLNDSDTAYFSEEAVRKLLRNEYEQCNRAVCIATRRKCDELIKVDESVEDAIKQLKGGKE